MLDRELVPVSTAYGEVRVKVGRRGGRVYNAQPEWDDCERRGGGERGARERGVGRGPRRLPAAGSVMTEPRTLYLTTPIYYVNDIPHVGHAYTTIAADVVTRARRLAGHDAFLLTGTDEHGQNIERIAREKGIPEQQHCDLISGKFRDLWKSLDIRYDDFIRTTEDRHKRGALHLWSKLCGAQDARTGARPSTGARTPAGTAPRCEGFKDEDELKQPGNLCPDHELPCEWTEEENFFFRLSAYADWLKDEIERGRITHRSRRPQERGPVRHPRGSAGLQREPGPGEVGDSDSRGARPRPLRLGRRALELHHGPRVWPTTAPATSATG